MKDLKITDVRSLPGDSGFLIDDGKTSILYDTGFGFTGYAVADNVKKALGDRELDYIFLTHSHYDHALGSPYVAARYPNVKVVAGEYAKKIFDKPTAKATMRDLDRKFATTCGVGDYQDLTDNLHVDIALNGGDTIKCGDMEFEVIALPGHTKCSIGFYLRENKLLLSAETLGVYSGEGCYLPSYLVGYGMTLESFERARALDIDSVLLPHYGLIGRDEAKKFLTESEKVTRDTAERIKNILENGGSSEDAIADFKERFYKGNVKIIYPVDAFNLNTSITVELVRRELTSVPAEQK